MKKIQFDIINGIYEVEKFDDDVELIDNCSMAYFELDDESRGAGIQGAEVDEYLYFLIASEYGIKNLIMLA
ncbi:hypothetical protein [Desulforegula conservatrix]|uniref:hypothetical protein n=1 Tax=Desulforegula conservatrix TaxID=153026 RepID=UPI0003F54287|nr:hypothetical protein [Desulforegula conservatrix]